MHLLTGGYTACAAHSFPAAPLLKSSAMRPFPCLLAFCVFFLAMGLVASSEPHEWSHDPWQRLRLPSGRMALDDLVPVVCTLREPFYCAFPSILENGCWQELPRRQLRLSLFPTPHIIEDVLHVPVMLKRCGASDEDICFHGACNAYMELDGDNFHKNIDRSGQVGFTMSQQWCFDDDENTADVDADIDAGAGIGFTGYRGEEQCIRCPLCEAIVEVAVSSTSGAPHLSTIIPSDECFWLEVDMEDESDAEDGDDPRISFQVHMERDEGMSCADGQGECFNGKCYASDLPPYCLTPHVAEWCDAMGIEVPACAGSPPSTAFAYV